MVSRAAIVLLVSGDTFLLTKRSTASKWQPGLWQIPGGAVDDGETFERAAIREAKEELNVDIDSKNLEFLGLVDYMNGASSDTDIVAFLCRQWSGEVHNMEPEKCQDMQWFLSSELPADSIVHVSPLINNIDASPSYILENNDQIDGGRQG